MNKYDTIKEAFDWTLVENINPDFFFEAQGKKGQTILVCKPQPRIDGLSRITIDLTAGKDHQGEVTIEYSAKILGARYSELISMDTIEAAHINIIRTGIIDFNIEEVLANARALKVHQTADFTLSNSLPTYGRAIRKLWVPNKYDLHCDARGRAEWESFSFLRDINANPEYLKFYNKLREFDMSKNREFRDKLTPAQLSLIRQYFQDKTRAELCLSGKRKIKQHLPDVDSKVMLIAVLNSKVDALGNLCSGLLAPLVADETISTKLDFTSSLADLREYYMACILEAGGFDFETVCENLKAHCSRSTFYGIKPKFKALLNRYLAHSSDGSGVKQLLGELQQAVAARVSPYGMMIPS